MEKVMSVEERIKKAEEIYARRQEGTNKKVTTVKLNQDSKKDIKLLKKLILQIILSLLIYLVFCVFQNTNYIFSKNFLDKINNILSYDMNFSQIMQNMKNTFNSFLIQTKNNENNEIQENNIVEENNVQNNIDESVVDDSNKEENNITDQMAIGGKEELSQEEQEIEEIKQTISFIKPVAGTISSKYGQREPTTITVPKNHTGVDIAANMGTKIVASTDGEVVIASEEGDYGKHLKIQNGKVSIIYAHCNNLYVKQGDKVVQGQEIAEVGSTGNSTGPHLHFEIRISENTIDPQKILEL